MDQPPLFFVSGLPRSGSTLLMNLLGQNPRHHVTPTNGLLDIAVLIRDRWKDLVEFQTQGITKCKPRIISALRGLMEGYYREELAAGKVIFDKSRGWLAYIEMMEEVLGRPIVVLVTVRDIRAIVASFEKLNQANPLTASRPENYILGQTIEGRASAVLADSSVLGLAISRLRDALRRPHKSRVFMIPYNQLCQNTQAVMGQLHDALGLPQFIYDPDHVEQITQEDDTLHGMPLHTVRQKVALLDPEPWVNVLPPNLCETLVRTYPDIQKYCSGT